MVDILIFSSEISFLSFFTSSTVWHLFCKKVCELLLSGWPKTFLGFQVRSHVSEVQLLLQRADFALRLHCLDPVVALGRVKSGPLIYSMNFCKSFVGIGHSELGFSQT